jgi:hypothetical protein
MHFDAERHGDHGVSRIDGGTAYVGDIDCADSAFPDRGGLPDGS